MATIRKWRGRLAFAATAAAVALMLAALGSSASGASATASAAKSVQIKHFAYHPGTLRVPKGSTVTFSNASGVKHTATARSFDTGVIKPGHSAAVRLTKTGTIVFHCTIHPFMHGKIIVE
jgi:plastocyanin